MIMKPPASRGASAAVALLLLAAAAPALAAPVCDLPATPPEIAVTTEITPPKFDFSMDRAGLRKRFGEIHLPDPRFYHIDLDRDALMGGRIAATHRVHYVTEKMKGGRACSSFDRVEVRLSATPVIYMAREYKKDACEFKELLVHELKHVEADRAVLSLYEGKMRDALRFTFSGQADFSIGPVPAGKLDEAQDALKAGIEGAVKAMFDNLMRDRMDMQRQIDNIGEYRHLSKACS